MIMISFCLVFGKIYTKFKSLTFPAATEYNFCTHGPIIIGGKILTNCKSPALAAPLTSPVSMAYQKNKAKGPSGWDRSNDHPPQGWMVKE